ncbi:MAG: hypothetical protein WBB25_22110 [Sulfitobacter sp.]
MDAPVELMIPQPQTVLTARLVGGGRMIVRAVQRLFGVALTMAAITIWMAPGATWESDVMLFKLILSLTAVLAGLGLMVSSKAPGAGRSEIPVSADRVFAGRGQAALNWPSTPLRFSECAPAIGRAFCA